ncbi:MAG: YadA C-terminal domain-containing protein [bacterium]
MKLPILKLAILSLLLPSVLLANITIVDNGNNSVTITQINPNGPNPTRNLTIGTDERNSNQQLNYQIVNNKIMILDTINPRTKNMGDFSNTQTNTINNDTLEMLFTEDTTSSNLKLNINPYDEATITGGENNDTLDIHSLNLQSNINNDSINSAKIQNGTIQHEDIQDNTITSAKIQNGTIQHEDIQDNTITSAKIQNGTIQNEDIQDGTITLEKLAPNVKDTFTDLKKGMAMQAAMTMSTLTLENKTLTLNLGYGSYSGYNAIASGLNYKINNNLAIKATVSSDLDKQIAGAAGLSFGIDL